LLRRQEASADTRQSLTTISSQEVDLLSQLRDLHRDPARKNPKESERLQSKFTDLHAQLKEVKASKSLLAKLLERLCLLKEKYTTQGVAALCENCQLPISAKELPECGAAEDLWDAWQALVLCPKCSSI
jgi:hypothetical protein